MPRVLKHPSVRKAELLAAAQALFFERGYDIASVEEIISRAGVSKGAFYHHFASKEALLMALAEQMAQATVAELGDLLGDDAHNAVERLNRLFGRARHMKVARASEILSSFEALFRPENIALYYRAHRATSEAVAPLLASIVAQGIEEGVFNVNDPVVTAEILLGLMTATHSVVANLFAARSAAEFRRAAAEFERRFVEQGIAIDRILGLPDGNVTLIERGFAEALFAGWRARQAMTS